VELLVIAYKLTLALHVISNHWSKVC